MMNIKIRNLMSISSADLSVGDETGRLHIVGGLNSVGKTALLELIAATALQDPKIRHARSESVSSLVVQAGSERGSCSIESDESRISLLFADGKPEVFTSGPPLQLGTALTLGESFLSSDKATRQRALIELADAVPTKSDLADWLLARKLGPKAADAVWERIEINGWDGACSDLKKSSTKLTGAWEQVAGRKFMPRNSEDWSPADLDPTETYDLPGLEQELSDLLQKQTDLLREDALRGADLEATAAAANSLAEQIAQRDVLRADLKKAEDDLAKAIQYRESLPPGRTTGKILTCPKCKCSLVTTISTNAGIPVTLKELPEISDQEDRKRGLELAGADGTCGRLRGEVSTLNSKIAHVNAAIDFAEKAKARMDRVDPAMVADIQKMQAAIVAKINKTRTIINLVKARDEAAIIYGKWKRNQIAIDGLSPAGIRREITEKKISVLNETISSYCARASAPEVVITADLDVMIRGRAPTWVSESDRYRADLILMAALCAKQQVKLTLIDRLDMLAPQARPGILKLFHSIPGLTTIIAMSARDAAALPNLAKARLGHTHWLEGGRLTLVA